MVSSVVVDPIVIAQRGGVNAAEVDIVVPQNLRYFDGHFPGAPVVPGVVQIRWAIALARRCFEIGYGFAGMEALKFHTTMTPGLRVTLALEHTATGKLRFAFASADVRYSSGRVLLRRAQ